MKHLQNLGKILNKQEQQSINGAYEDEGQAQCTCTDDNRMFPVVNCGLCLELCRGGYWCFGPVE